MPLATASNPHPAHERRQTPPSYQPSEVLRVAPHTETRQAFSRSLQREHSTFQKASQWHACRVPNLQMTGPAPTPASPGGEPGRLSTELQVRMHLPETRSLRSKPEPTSEAPQKASVTSTEK